MTENTEKKPTKSTFFAVILTQSIAVLLIILSVLAAKKAAPRLYKKIGKFYKSEIRAETTPDDILAFFK